jgi:zinc D-Ala-D-Ala carboxypeptidase
MRTSRRGFLMLAVALLVGCRSEAAGVVVGTSSPTATGTPTASSSPVPTATATATATVAFDSVLYVLVDKERALPGDFTPDGLATIPAEWHADGFGGLQLRGVAIDALRPMVAAAATDGVALRIRSAYRSYAEQERTFAYWVSVLGEVQARRESAEPGHSEHQLGVTADFASPENGWELLESFAVTSAGEWLAEHSYEYGFALSYPRDGEEITGYIFEPWHYRYIGIPAATAWHESGLTLIEYLEGLQPGATARP